jgi:hypothetical protein
MFLILNINHIKKINEFEYEEEVENKILPNGMIKLLEFILLHILMVYL